MTRIAQPLLVVLLWLGSIGLGMSIVLAFWESDTGGVTGLRLFRLVCSAVVSLGLLLAVLWRTWPARAGNTRAGAGGPA